MLHYVDPLKNSVILDLLSEAAALEDEGQDISRSVEQLMASAMLKACDPSMLVRWLVAIAEANLPIARLAEGHVNATRLIRHFGGTPVNGLHGVWGADGVRPCRLEGARIVGDKRFASGLGVVKHAVVTVESDGATLLAVVDVTETDRQAPAAWDMLGMKATLSGKIQLDGLEPHWLGGPDDYFQEPLFFGGVWRIAALQLGGTFGLLEGARTALAEVGHLEADAQIARLAPLLARAMAAFGLVERAAETAEGPAGRADPDRAVALSIQARLLTEDLAQDAIAAVERSVGLRHFERTSATGRIARDLATYCRQAARDAFEQRAARIVLARPGRLSEIWHG